MSRYAAQTDVSSDRSRAEIERTLARYGADQFVYGWRRDAALVEFVLNNRHVRFLLPMPSRDDPVFWRTPYRGLLRSPEAAGREYEQAVRQRWRALALVIKAKLEAVEANIVQFDSEFMAHLVLPDGGTIGDRVVPAIDRMIAGGDMPRLLPDLS